MATGGGACCRRIYHPGNTPSGAPRPKEQEHTRMQLLEQIQCSYQEALQRMKCSDQDQRSPSVLMRLLQHGFCFGLLDPVSNIIANTIIAYPTDDLEALANLDYVPMLKKMEMRSLDGLVTFLTCFFPHLADWEAVRYLLLASADLFAAAELIARDRFLGRFGQSFDDSKVALRISLKCAALAAKYTQPDHLVDAWMSLCCNLHRAEDILSTVQPNAPYNHWDMFKLLCQGTPPYNVFNGLGTVWCLAASRNCDRKVLYRHYWSKKRVLLDIIHNFYLRALARLPVGELRSRYHRSMLKGGHCYGPLDPVSNIIINTISYDILFPPSRKLKLDIISTASLLRIEACSLYGLISYLCTRYQNLSLHEAICCLLMSSEVLPIADPKLYDPKCLSVLNDHCSTLSKVKLQAPCTSEKEAFNAAAAAAWHPNPDAQGELLSSHMRMTGCAALSLLNKDGQLSYEDVCCLAGLLSPEPPAPSNPHQQQTVRKRKISSVTEDQIEDWMHEHETISRKVKAALAAYNLQNGEPMYELHIICTVNDAVSGPEYCANIRRGSPFIYHHSHINFLAKQKGDCFAGQAPILFFAELNNDDDDEDGRTPLCFPVNFPLSCTEQVRCLYCEHKGAKIVHPATRKFHGGESEFQKMVCGEDIYDDGLDPEVDEPFYTNYSIISHSQLASDFVGGLEEDCMYYDSADGIVVNTNEDDNIDFV